MRSWAEGKKNAIYYLYICRKYVRIIFPSDKRSNWVRGACRVDKKRKEKENNNNIVKIYGAFLTTSTVVVVGYSVRTTTAVTFGLVFAYYRGGRDKTLLYK